MSIIIQYCFCNTIIWNRSLIPQAPEKSIVPVRQYYATYTTSDDYPRFLLSTKVEGNGWDVYRDGEYYNGFYAYGADQPGVVPVYQYYSPYRNKRGEQQGFKYFYSTNPNDPNGGQGWTREFAIFHAYQAPQSFTQAIYQYYISSTQSGTSYMYSIHPNLNRYPGWERWNYEKIAFYASNGRRVVY